MGALPDPSSTEVPASLESGVPFVDLRHSTESVRAQILADFAVALTENAFVNGPQVSEFERRFAAWCGVDQCVGVASGLDALRLGLLAMGVGVGDQVVVPALTFIATFEAVTQVGATPVVVDVQDADYNLDPEAAADAVGDRTRCLLPVHLYGQMADMLRLVQIARRNDLLLLEDACQAHGATRDGLRPGAVGDAAAFSFYPSKNLGAMGDAGALLMHDEQLAERVRALREHGQTSKYRSDLLGYTARLDTLQAVVLLRKLPLLKKWNAARAQAAAFYSRELSGVGDLQLPPAPAGSVPAWHLYVVRTKDPESLAKHVAARGVATARHYPELPHLSPAYAELGLKRGAFPVAEAIAREGVSLPLFPGISETQLSRVCDAVKTFFASG